MDAFHSAKKSILIAFASLVIGPGCDQAQDPSLFQGYVEGDYLYLASPVAGFLNSLNADRGAYVQAHGKVFSIDPSPEQFELGEAEAQMDSAQQKLNNLKEPRREPEIASLRAELQSKEASRRYAQAQLQRLEELAKNDFAAKDRVDEARSLSDEREAQVKAARKQLELYEMSFGRPAEIGSAQADLLASAARLNRTRWQVDQKSVVAPTTGQVTESYYRPGEWVPAGQPVLSFLPDNRRRIRFFVAQSQITRIRMGQQVEVECDGCAARIPAQVNFIAPQAEYTPPVIYSRESRAKLVFRVEAMPSAEHARNLPPGLPVDVRLAEGP